MDGRSTLTIHTTGNEAVKLTVVPTEFAKAIQAATLGKS
jgi:hypothetical protein